MANKHILLIEPGYKNKYPPLGLMKLAAYHGPYGKNDNVRFIKGDHDRSVYGVNWNRIYITTLFSFEWKEIAKSIDSAIRIAKGDTTKVFVGGIAASLMHGRFAAEPRWRGVRFISGLLSGPPAESLQLDDFTEELYSDDLTGTPIEDLVPDYSILDQIRDQYVYPVHDAYFMYASRGCIRKCHFCGVPKLEGMQRDAQSITSMMQAIEERHGAKRDLMLMDNNVVASANYKNIIAEIRDNGFERGAMFRRPGKPAAQRRVDFNQGVDARILCKDKMYLEQMATIAIRPLRIAFDHLGMRRVYETAIHMAHEVGLHDLSNYMLYNFKDSPSDLYERMKLNIDLNEKLNIRIFSFPMRYQPTDLPERSFVSESWNRYYLRSIQIILQATHGIVSGAPDFFRRAFGKDKEEFERLLLRPQHYLFNRFWYEDHEGRAEFAQFSAEFAQLSATERSELAALLSGTTPSGFAGLIGKADSSKVNRILSYYVPIPKDDEAEIWKLMKQRSQESKNTIALIPEDELVEDAGLVDAGSIQLRSEFSPLKTSMTVSAINIVAKPKTLIASDIIIGKDILELLANAMYVDPRTVYREYIQNAADSMDEARLAGRSMDYPQIDINLDHATRTVRIRDNGEGVPNTEFVNRVTAIGASHKRGTDLRGFRGVGRLSGLGYCQELIFRGKAEGDSKVVEVTWNSRALKEKIRDLNYAGSLINVVHEVVTYAEVPATDRAERFFEVEMRKVGRLKNDLLMNEPLIRSYLSQVAPVPFHPEFTFGHQIQSFLTDRGVRPPIRIELNDNAGPIFHRARNTIEFNPKTVDALRSIEFVEIAGDDGELAAFGWISDHAYMGAIPKKTGLGGIRLRSGNIQVGDESLLAPLYPEPRFSSWTIGDIHVSSKKIIPNGRRDDFEHTAQYTWLQSELGTRASELGQRIRTRSQRRQRLRNVQLQFQALDDWFGLAERRDTPLLLRKALRDLTEEHVHKAAKEVQRLGDGTDDHQLAFGRLDALSNDVCKLGKKIERAEQSKTGAFSKATEKALLKALKVVLSNARSAKLGAKTALDIVSAVSSKRK